MSRRLSVDQGTLGERLDSMKGSAQDREQEDLDRRAEHRAEERDYFSDGSEE